MNQHKQKLQKTKELQLLYLGTISSQGTIDISLRKTILVIEIKERKIDTKDVTTYRTNILLPKAIVEDIK
jgi:hypothetical protein